MGSNCLSPAKKQVSQPSTNSSASNKAPTFTASTRQLHTEYVKLVLYVRENRLFSSRSERLVGAVHRYFEKQFKFQRSDLDVACVDCVRKLHPRDYWFGKIDQQWLIQACLRQQKFSDETKVQKITYDHAYPEYLQFLSLCKYNFDQKNGAITVPSKCQDVIWHSHMQDPEKYKNDMMNYMGKLLNHMDDIPDEELKKHSQMTKKLTIEKNQNNENKKINNNQMVKT